MTDANTQHLESDVGRQQVGAIYAKALLAAAEKTGTTDELLAEFDALIEEVLDKFPKFDATLASPRISHEAKVGMLERVLAGRISAQLLTFLKVVSSHGRLDCLRAIRVAAGHLHNELRHRVEVRLTTAKPLDPSLVGLVTNVLRGVVRSDIELTAETQPDLIGGMVVRVGDTVYDASVAGELSRLRDEVLAGSAKEMQEKLDRFMIAE